MRWPFSRRRNESAAPGLAAQPSAGPAPAPPQRRAEWATLPPIQRAAGGIELTAESEAFVENLTSYAPVETALQPLGHDVTMEAPAGMATGIARPVEHHAGDAPLRHRLRPAPAPKPAARTQRAPLASPAPPAPAPAPAEVAREEEQEEQVEEQAATVRAEEAATSPAEEAATSPAEEPPAPPVQRAPERTPPAPVAGTSPVARHETGAPHEDEVAAAPTLAADAPAEVQRAADDEEEAATVREGADAVQRAAEEPAPGAVPIVGARPVVTPQIFHSSLSPAPATAAPERSAPLEFAAQRPPSEAGASAPAAGASPEQPAAAAQTPGPAPVVGDAAAIQRAAVEQPTSRPPVVTAPSSAEPPVAPAAATPTAEARRAAGDPARVPAPARQAAAPGVQRARETTSPASAPGSTGTGSAPTAGARRLGLGAPLEFPESVERGSFTPEGLPARTFRRTRSLLATQRAPAGEAPAAAPGQPPVAPVAGAKPPLSAPTPAPPTAGRSRAEAPDTPLPPASAPGVQRASDDRSPEPGGRTPVHLSAEAGGEQVSGFDAFVAHASALAAGRTPADADPGGELEHVQRAPDQVDFPAEAATLAPRLDLPRRSRARPPAGAGADTPTAPETAGVQRSPTGAPSGAAIVPLVGRRALRVQRSSEDVPPPIRSGVEQHMSTSLEGVKVHRNPESASAARQLSARAFTTGGEIHLPAEHGPLDREPASSLVAHELVHVAQQRELGDRLPSEESDHGQRLEAQAQHVEATSRQAVVPLPAPQRSPVPLVLARRAESAPRTAAAAAATASAVAAAGLSSPGSTAMAATAPQLAPAAVPTPTHVRVLAAPTAAPTVQRAVEIEEMTTNVNVDSATNAAQTGATGHGSSHSTSFDPLTGLVAQTDESSQPLMGSQLEQAWTYVRARLTDELLADRERMGLSIDIF